MNGKLVRSASLVTLIISAGAFCALCWVGFAQYKPMIIPAVAFTGIYVWVLIMEVVGALTGVRKTLSTRWKHWAALHPVLSWAALALFWLAMSALVIHLGVYQP